VNLSPAAGPIVALRLLSGSFHPIWLALILAKQLQLRPPRWELHHSARRRFPTLVGQGYKGRAGEPLVLKHVHVSTPAIHFAAEHVLGKNAGRQGAGRIRVDQGGSGWIRPGWRSGHCVEWLTVVQSCVKWRAVCALRYGDCLPFKHAVTRLRSEGGPSNGNMTAPIKHKGQRGECAVRVKMESESEWMPGREA
jgi:hypothetical protein